MLAEPARRAHGAEEDVERQARPVLDRGGGDLRADLLSDLGSEVDDDDAPRTVVGVVVRGGLFLLGRGRRQGDLDHWPLLVFPAALLLPSLDLIDDEGVQHRTDFPRSI
jgi:hypothetical protein